MVKSKILIRPTIKAVNWTSLKKAKAKIQVLDRDRLLQREKKEKTVVVLISLKDRKKTSGSKKNKRYRKEHLIRQKIRKLPKRKKS